MRIYHGENVELYIIMDGLLCCIASDTVHMHEMQ